MPYIKLTDLQTGDDIWLCTNRIVKVMHRYRRPVPGVEMERFLGAEVYMERQIGEYDFEGVFEEPEEIVRMLEEIEAKGEKDK